MSLIEVGPFTLHAVLGQGGMGVVWRGVHQRQDHPVAVKVITSAHAANPIYRAGFAREVQAIARLHHPGICRVLDYGVLDERAARASQGQLAQGSSWLAMELAARGSLESAPPPSSWRELRTILLEILDALAHSHARGIVHRDLKPGNILIADSLGEHARYLLTDFGLAHAYDATRTESTRDGLGVAAGTPHYMPPEQLQGHWRDYGPWTDLYAVGCLAWELCCGRTPFVGDNFILLASKHLNEPPPPLKNLFPVPHDLEAWIHTLLRKDLRRRFTRAADAAWALRNMGPPTRAADPLPDVVLQTSTDKQSLFFSPTLPALEGRADGPTLSDLTLPVVPARLDALRQRDRVEFGAAMTTPYSTPTRPPMPRTWRRADARPPLELVGAGLGLFGLRETPFVGRESERDELWAALHDVYTTNTARAVVVRGRSGAGKSRLVEWMGERASELGVAGLLRVTHSPGGSNEGGIVHALCHTMRCAQLSRARVYQRLRASLSSSSSEGAERTDQDAAALTELFVPARATGDETGPSMRFGAERERHAALLALLEHMCTQRPVILWLDDAQWSSESMSIALALLDHDLPLLVALTVRDDALASGSTPARLLRQVGAHARAQTIALRTLDDTAHHELVSQLLGFSPTLTRRLARQTHGDPLFAIQLVSQLVSQDALRPGSSGFELHDEQDNVLAPSIQALWEQRLADFDRAGFPSWRETLEVAAALGQTFSRAELRAALALSGLPAADGLIEAMIVRGMLAPSVERADSARWEHAMLREAIASRSEREGRWTRWHSILADTMQGAHTEHGLERRGHHLIEAHRLDEAIAVLLEAAQQNLSQSNYARTLQIIELRDAACDAARLDESSIERARSLPLRISLLRFHGQLEEAAALIEEVLGLTQGRQDALGLRADALRAKTNTARIMGDLDAARAAGEASIELYERVGDMLGVLRSLQSLGWVRGMQGDVDAARALYERGDALGEQLDNLDDRAWCLLSLSELDIRAANLDAAERYARHAQRLFERAHARGGLAMIENNFGQIAALRGDVRAAIAHYEASTTRWRLIGSGLVWVPYYRIIMLAIAQRDFERAHELVIDRSNASRESLHNMRSAVVNMTLAAQQGHDETFDAYARHVHVALDTTSSVYPDALYAIEACVELFEGRSDHARVVESLQIGARLLALSNSPAWTDDHPLRDKIAQLVL